MFGTKKVKSIGTTQPSSGAAAPNANAGAGSGANAGSAALGADEDAAASDADADAAASSALAEVGQTTSDATAASDARVRGFEAAGAAVEPKVVVSAPASVPKAAEAVPGASALGVAAPAPTSVSAGAAGELWRVVTQNVHAMWRFYHSRHAIGCFTRVIALRLSCDAIVVAPG